MSKPDEPLDLLSELEDEASADFVRAVIRRVDRLETAAHLVRFGVDIPKTLFGELLSVLGDLSELRTPGKGNSE